MIVLVKIFDNIVSTMKNIATYKEKRLSSTILVIISQFLSYFIVSVVAKDNSIELILLISLGAGFGNYVAMLINDKLKKDSKWTMALTSSNKLETDKLVAYLKDVGVRHLAMSGANLNGESATHILAFSQNKHESRLIEDFLRGSDIKYMKEII